MEPTIDRSIIEQQLATYISYIHKYDPIVAEKLTQIFDDCFNKIQEKPPEEFRKEMARRFAEIFETVNLEKNPVIREFYQALCETAPKIFELGGETLYKLQADGLAKEYIIPKKLLSQYCTVLEHQATDLEDEELKTIDITSCLEFVKDYPNQNEIIESFLCYLTQKKFDVNDSNVEGLMELAFYSESPSLMDQCISWWIRTTNKINLEDRLEKAITYYNRRLADYCCQFIQENDLTLDELESLWFWACEHKFANIQMICLLKAHQMSVPESMIEGYNHWSELLDFVAVNKAKIQIIVKKEVILPLWGLIQKSPIFHDQNPWFKTPLALKFHNISDEYETIADIIKANALVTGIDFSDKSNRMNPTDVSILAEAIAHNDTIKTVNFAGKGIRPDVGVNLTRALIQNQKLKEVDLSKNDLSFAAIISMLEQIGDHPSIQKLNLNQTFLFIPIHNECLSLEKKQAVVNLLWEARALDCQLNGDRTKTLPLTEEYYEEACSEITEILYTVGPRALSDALAKNQSLIEIRLDDNHLEDKTCAIILESLFSNQTLEFLSFNYNQLGSESISILSEALKKNKGLKTLLLANCKINADDAERLASIFLMNRSLNQLNLRGNRIGDRGTVAFAEALESNPIMRALHLNLNDIGPEGANSFAALIAKNPPLTYLSLNGNPIGDEGAEAIVSALESNTHLHVVDLRDCKLSRTMLSQLKGVKRILTGEKKEGGGCVVC
ncbi:MAG: hypothetical protein K940chlam3_01483 [Chlamydiae bacterium]|nr:hypothetical protein [Chlamydiota bacterium]